MHQRPEVPESAQDPPPQPGAGNTGSLGAVNAVVPKIVPFSDLARCGDEIWIENDGQIYRLRKTKQGKLILTK